MGLKDLPIWLKSLIILFLLIIILTVFLYFYNPKDKVESKNDCFRLLADKLDSCTPFFCQDANYTLGGVETRIVGIVDGKCLYLQGTLGTTETQESAGMYCRYNESQRKEMAQFYRDLEKEIDYAEGKNPLLNAMKRSICIVNSGYGGSGQGCPEGMILDHLESSSEGGWKVICISD